LPHSPFPPQEGKRYILQLQIQLGFSSANVMCNKIIIEIYFSQNFTKKSTLTSCKQHPHGNSFKPNLPL
jgi:hypothetical protein